MPTFVKNFMAVKHLVDLTQKTLDDIFSVVDETQNILEENIDDPSPHVSLNNKRQKRKQVSKKATRQHSESEVEDHNDEWI